MENRRSNVIKELEHGSIAIFYSGIAPVKSEDQKYPFCVNRNFYYLTGINEENAALVLIKDSKTTGVYLFIEGYNEVNALWNAPTITKDKAKDLSGISVEDILDITFLDDFLFAIFNNTRKSKFGIVDKCYFDLNKKMMGGIPQFSELECRKIEKLYPHIMIRQSSSILSDLRTIKDNKEITYIKNAINITKIGLDKIINICKNSVNEDLIERTFLLNALEHHTNISFDTIVAGAKNATILHYTNNDSLVNNGELVLCDLGTTYKQYAADISRTYPVGGLFSKRQAEIYEIVLKANKETIKWLRPGVTFDEFNLFGKKILIEGLKKIGLIKEDIEISKYYYHSLGHFLGLDVHDVGNYSLVIKEGMVITVEPGLYIKEENIGIRIEDDVLITKDGAINLSSCIVKEVKEIEDLFK